MRFFSQQVYHYQNVCRMEPNRHRSVNPFAANLFAGWIAYHLSPKMFELQLEVFDRNRCIASRITSNSRDSQSTRGQARPRRMQWSSRPEGRHAQDARSGVAGQRADTPEAHAVECGRPEDRHARGARSGVAGTRVDTPEAHAVEWPARGPTRPRRTQRSSRPEGRHARGARGGAAGTRVGTPEAHGVERPVRGLQRAPRGGRAGGYFGNETSTPAGKSGQKGTFLRKNTQKVSPRCQSSENNA